MRIVRLKKILIIAPMEKKIYKILDMLEANIL
uniref:Uncharacterized protein n=1 Tax=virus sp. ctML55 TaxID=2827627 RepID=A0A8S5RJM2_9VIRU|nr:MAG TPA: hypothetical protein [virus sp. ctML55]DAW92036.1 MAG TPA: hypothetical protein [Bacteriophage sp.]